MNKRMKEIKKAIEQSKKDEKEVIEDMPNHPKSTVGLYCLKNIRKGRRALMIEFLYEKALEDLK